MYAIEVDTTSQSMYLYPLPEDGQMNDQNMSHSK